LFFVSELIILKVGIFLVCAVTPWTGECSITKAHCYEGNFLEQGSNARPLCFICPKQLARRLWSFFNSEPEIKYEVQIRGYWGAYEMSFSVFLS